MRKVTLGCPVDGGHKTKPNVTYLMEDQQIPCYAVKTNGNLLVDTFLLPDEHHMDGKDIVVFRAGGAGDVLFSFPLFGELKRQYPNSKTILACHAPYHFIAKNCKNIDSVLDFPLEASFVPKEASFINLEGAIEENNELPAVDAMFWEAGISPSSTENIKNDFVYTPAPEMVANLLARFPKTPNIKRIGYQWKASTPVRSYPHKNSCVLVTELLLKGYDVAIMGEPDSIQIGTKPAGATGNLLNLTEHSLSWEESIAFLKTCDLVVGPDSSNIHFAGAMGIKGLGIYGPFKWSLRTNYFDSIWCVQGLGPCAPCFHHSNNRDGLLPRDKPCSTTGECEVLKSIHPEKILKKIQQLI